MDRPSPESGILKPRHVTMISVGGIVGAGLLVGSSATIATVGPAALVSYAVAGVAMLLIMLTIRDMAGHQAGSFTELVRKGLGEEAGFVAGWLYWYFWAVVVPIEALAAATILQAFIPLPVWQIGLVLLTGMTAINLVSTRSFGEFEFWMSSIKVGGVVTFIAVAGAWAAGLSPASAPSWSNLYIHGGFAPNGPAAILAGIPSAIFALTGAEIATLAAAASSNPARAAGRIARSLALRIVLFYLVAIVLIVSILPWRDVIPGVSPFASALEALHVPGGASIMSLVVLAAVISCLNTSLFITSRVLRTLASRGDAPSSLGWLNARGAPTRAIVLSSLFGYVALFFSVVSPQLVFGFLINTSGAVMMFVYILLCVARLAPESGGSGWQAPRLRRAWGPLTVIGIMLAAFAGMLLTPTLASQLYFGGLAAAIAVGAVLLRRASRAYARQTRLRLRVRRA